MTEQVFLGVPLSELRALIADVVNECLQHNTPQTEDLPIEIIDRSELCKRLGITEPTAIRWGQKGKIPSFRIGSSVRYNWRTVMEKLEGCKSSSKTKKLIKN